MRPRTSSFELTERVEAANILELESLAAGPSSGRRTTHCSPDIESMMLSSSALDDYDHDTQPLLHSSLHDTSLERHSQSATSISLQPELETFPFASAKYHAGTGSLPSLDTPSDTESSLQADDLVEPDEEGLRFSELLMVLFGRSRGKGRTLELDVDAYATKRSVFDDETLAKHYWPKEDYEGFKRFDAKARWTFREEKVRYILPALFACSCGVDAYASGVGLHLHGCRRW